MVTKEKINDVSYTVVKNEYSEKKIAENTTASPVMIEVIINDRHGHKERVKCLPTDTVLILKKLTAARLGTRYEKLRIQRGNSVLSDLVTLDDYEIKGGSSLELYYN